MIKLSYDNVLFIHDMLYRKTHGMDGIRSESLLDSAINAPFQTFDGLYIYKDILEIASRLCYNLIKNHPFFDGNKRLGVLSMLTFLKLNNINHELTNSDIINIGINLASSTWDYQNVLLLLKEKCKL